jgi:hypothetical protein
MVVVLQKDPEVYTIVVDYTAGLPGIGRVVTKK